MRVTCDDCGKRYDDVYRRRYCPHERFEMHCVVTGPDGKKKGVARTLGELDRLMALP